MLTHSLQAGMQGKGDREIGTKPYLILGTQVPVGAPRDPITQARARGAGQKPSTLDLTKLRMIQSNTKRFELRTRDHE